MICSLVLLCYFCDSWVKLMIMNKKGRIPQAPSQPMPELEEFLSQFRVHFYRRESEAAMERYVTGLLTEHPNKNCDTLAQVVPGTSEQRLQGLLTAMVWDEQDLNQQRVAAMRQVGGEGDGVLILDDTGFAKQGRASVGVARQYSGTLGKVANCQVTVNCHYAERTLGWPVSTRLYLPQDWAEDEERRDKARVPEEIQFQTKAEIALELLDQATAWGVGHAAVVTDADYGDNPRFLDGLEARQERYVVGVRANFSVTLSRRADEPVQRADQVLAGIPRRRWRTIRWREGSQGWLRAKFVALRCWRVDGEGRRRIGWLIGQRPGRGQTGDGKYYGSNFSNRTPLEVMVEYAHRRHWVEQYHEEAKGELGWDQYQGRLWPGFHRNAVLVMLSYSFLVWLEWQQRQQQRRRGRRRGPFSPSAGSAAALAASHPSPSHRMASAGSHS
ncbi:MAG: IS701 family transposase [Acidobacteria bacterium]|nr:MAG: IS701 family transposase [Acidobacteriota bacterium]